MSPPGEATQRVFIAVDPPVPVREELFGWLRELSLGPAARHVPAHNMHLTLAFLGRRTDFEIELAEQAMRDATEAVGTLETGAPVWLPRRKPRALAVEVRQAGGGLGELQARLSDELTSAIGFEAPRSFRPHITVARFGRAAEPRRGELPPTPALKFTPATVTLYRSILSPEGAEYESLAAVDLPG